MSTVDLSELAALPGLVQRLQAKVDDLEAKLAQPDDGQLLDVQGAADLLQLSRSALRQAAYRGTIPSVRIGRRLRFRRSELMKLR
jgi:excisionase family DNA binding protein